MQSKVKNVLDELRPNLPELLPDHEVELAFVYARLTRNLVKAITPIEAD